MTTPAEPTDAELINALIAADDRTATTPSPPIWHNAIIPWSRQLDRAERRGDIVRAARIRALIAEHEADTNTKDS